MNKEVLQPLSGFRDYSGPTKDWLIAGLRKIFLQYGYQPLETPAIEKQELLLKDYGEEAQKLLYLFEDNGKRKVGLRYDLTVPLARFVAANWQNLPQPYKRFEIGPSWRAERAQKGRLRQFTQADIDIIGTDSLAAEKEALSIVAAIERLFGIKFEVQLNDRNIVSAVLDKLKVNTTIRQKLLQTLDKKDKLSEEQLSELLSTIGLSDVQLRQIKGVFLENESIDETSDLIGAEKTSKLVELIDNAKSLDLAVKYVPYMVRGLDYYTGTIIECRIDGYPSSVAGGGRYDNLVESLIGQKIPAFGLSFGVDRLVDILDEQGTFAEKTIFIARLQETTDALNSWVRELRAAGNNIEVYLDPTVELGKQIKYADKRGFTEILIPLEEEWKKGKIIVKNLSDGSQKALSRDQI